MTGDTAKVLQRALELIQERGRARGVPEDVAGRVCAGQAIQMAELEIGPVADCWDDGAWSLLRQAGDPRMSLTQWNDSPSTSDEDVVLAFKKAIAAAEDATTECA